MIVSEVDHYEIMDMFRNLVRACQDTPYIHYFNQWVDYQSDLDTHRTKFIYHDIRLKDGKEYLGYLANGASWNKWREGEGPSTINDSDVTHIRISANQKR